MKISVWLFFSWGAVIKLLVSSFQKCRLFHCRSEIGGMKSIVHSVHRVSWTKNSAPDCVVTIYCPHSGTQRRQCCEAVMFDHGAQTQRWNERAPAPLWTLTTTNSKSFWTFNNSHQTKSPLKQQTNSSLSRASTKRKPMSTGKSSSCIILNRGNYIDFISSLATLHANSFANTNCQVSL